MKGTKRAPSNAKNADKAQYSVDPRVQEAVQHYADTMNARTDMTAESKAAAIEKYAKRMNDNAATEAKKGTAKA